jgi:uncharacterized protein (DUF1501 family)
MTAVTRRNFLNTLAIASAGIAMPRLLFANSNTDARFVFIILRGALDGLAAVPPYGDSNYRNVRGTLTIASPGTTDGALKLDGMFGLNPSLTNLHQRFTAGELTVLHAVSSPYRERSHFDGQDLLENGTTKPHGANDGWLNRSLSAIAPDSQTEKLAMAFAQNVPLVLRGSMQVGSWAPSRLSDASAETLQRIADMYAGNDYFTSRLQAAMAADAMAADAGSMDSKRDPLRAITTITSTAGRMLKAVDGPRVAVIETNGWDTHANQGAAHGLLANRLAALDSAIESLRVEIGDAWQKTVVLVATEFGRTVAVNGTRGTDHGTGGCAFLVGGAVKGGRVIADWPGLANGNLYQGRDLQPTLDLRSVFKGVLMDHVGVSESSLERKVFPDSSSAKPLSGLIK